MAGGAESAAARVVLAGTIVLTVVAATLGGQPSSARAADCPWVGSSQSPDRRAHQVLSQMTLDEKISMVHQPDPIWQHYGVAGYIPPIPRLCVPDLMLNDGPSGVADQEINTVAFPVPLARAATWDTSLAREFGRALGWEAWHKGVNVQLAPNVNIARFPMNGRNSEAFGEDPYLTGQTGAAEIQGIQENPVIATVKHYALNNHEVNRMTVSSDAGDRVVHEIYLPAFEAAVREGHTGSVMCSYNRIAGTYACENARMQNDILKGELGFDGFIMSDWGGTHSTVQSARAGLDMEMDVAPGKYFGDALKSAVQSGQVPMSRLDDMVVRILRAMFQVGIFESPHAPEPQAYQANVEIPEDVALARRISEDGTVLLKNVGGALPIQGNGRRIAVIGRAGGPEGTAESYGTGGSSHVPEAGGKTDVVTPFDGIQRRAAADSDLVTYNDGGSMADAAVAAAAADVAVVFANDAESEGQDRPDLSLGNARSCNLFGCTPMPTDQDQLIRTVAAANPNTVVVLDTGGPMLMPWLGDVKSVLQAWYPGQEDGNAIAALLFGDVSPSGKLPQTFPGAMSDLPVRTPQQYPGVDDSKGVPHASYSEGLFVGYRWYDAKGIQPLFPFGFGLSYTTFELRNLRVTPKAKGATVKVDVANTGSRPGAEVPQAYLGMPAATDEPPKRLVAFDKVFLRSGQTRTVTLELGRRAFSYWDSAESEWREAPGCYEVFVGRSSRDTGLCERFALNGGVCGAQRRASCLSRRAGVGRRNIGRVRLGSTRRRLRRLPGLTRRTRRSYRFCVNGGSGQVRAAFSPRGRVLLVATTAPGHGARGVRPGGSTRRLRRAYPRRRRVATLLFRASPRSTALIGVLRGRVRFWAVADARLLRHPRALRAYLRYAGLAPTSKRRGRRR